MLLKRVITAAFLLVVLILVLWANGSIPWFAIGAAVAALFGLYEFYGMVCSSGKGKPVIWLGMTLALLFIFQPLSKWSNDGGILLTASVLLPLLWVMLRKNRDGACSSWAFTLAGVMYLGWLASRYTALIQLDKGKEWVILALFPTFASDTAAYFVGRALGRHKMAPSISPGKTWEGAAGGVLGAMLVSLLIVWLFTRRFAWFSPLPIGAGTTALLGVAISLFAQIGDLVESLFKRNMGAKDSGKALPGHGGMLDRIDSVVFAGLVVYYYVIWLA
ncbi:MAG: phosphatidate cytidylyltransferase [Dehalococcoidales bacterium]|jgi:phosphatidate cytidylyltransferase